jgi:hypothetical protein
MLLDIIPNNHIHNLKSSGVTLNKPANDTFLHGVMRDFIRNSIQQALDCPLLDKWETFDIIRQELEAARIVQSLNTYRSPDDCA